LLDTIQVTLRGQVTKITGRNKFWNGQPWLKCRSEFKTENKEQPAENLPRSTKNVAEVVGATSSEGIRVTIALRNGFKFVVGLHAVAKNKTIVEFVGRLRLIACCSSQCVCMSSETVRARWQAVMREIETRFEYY